MNEVNKRGLVRLMTMTNIDQYIYACMYTHINTTLVLEHLINQSNRDKKLYLYMHLTLSHIRLHK